MRHMFLGHFSLRNSLVRVLNVYITQVKVEKHRSGQGQVAKGQLSNMKKHGHAAHVFRSSFKKEFTCNGLKSVFKTLKRPND